MPNNFHLVCVHPFQGLDGTRYERGTVVTDPDKVDSLTFDREHHFVRVHTDVFGGGVEPGGIVGPLGSPVPDEGDAGPRVRLDVLPPKI